MSGIRVTIKYGKGYEETWAVFDGSPGEIREQLGQYFGLPQEAMEGLTLSELVVNCTNLAHGKGNIAGMLGATILPSSAAKSDPIRSDYSTDDPWAAAAQQSAAQAAPAPKAEPTIDPNAWVLGEIAKSKTVTDLKKLWAENQTFFSDPDVMSAWKARGKALSA